MFDLIGDIHGHRDALERLLTELGYRKDSGVYRHATRRAFFVGDLIDRGPDSKGVVKLVRDMVEAGSALVVMGNHEFNAIQYHTEDPDYPGKYLRVHNDKNIHQHENTLKSYKGDLPALASDLEWFKTIPLYYEDEHCRVVHACWQQHYIDYIKKNYENKTENPGMVSPVFFHKAVKSGGDDRAYEAVEVLLKGLERPIPEFGSLKDKAGGVRKEARVKWWKESEAPFAETLDEAMMPSNDLGGIEVGPDFFTGIDFYLETEKPVFFGHYWKQGSPQLDQPNVCCLDYSVAMGGKLTAYRFDGEKILSADKFVQVSADFSR